MSWLLACVLGPGEGTIPRADSSLFYAEAEPVLMERCSNPSCHGSADRPLEVYAVHRHRLDPDQVWLDASMNVEEHQANFQRSRAFLIDPALGDPAGSLLLLKGLAPEAGGVPHVGGTIFAESTEADWLSLYDFVMGVP